MIRLPTLTMPLNDALGRDVAAILGGAPRRFRIAEGRAIRGAGGAVLLAGIIAAAALFAPRRTAGVEPEHVLSHVLPTARRVSRPVPHDLAERSPEAGQPHAPSPPAKPVVPAAAAVQASAAPVPRPGPHRTPFLLRAKAIASYRPRTARPLGQVAAVGRRPVPAAETVQPWPAPDRPRTAPPTTLAAAAPTPAPVPEAAPATAEGDHASPASDGTMVASTSRKRHGASRQAAIDAIHNLRRQ